MGRYMQRKGRISNEVAVMEVSAQPPLGVRTRARTLALQRLQKPPEPPSPDLNSSYLQLRNRRLEKPSSSPPPSKHQGSSFSKSAPSAEADGGVEVSFGENVLELETRDRSTRETTPCSLIRDSESIRTPASTTRNSASLNRRMQSSTPRDIPTAQEMEEFFAATEQLQHRIFAEKYNFDPVNDCPLPGRYEWVKLDA